MSILRSALNGQLRNPETYIGNKVQAYGTVSATLSLDPTAGNVFTLTPGASFSINAASVVPGQELIVAIYTSGVTSFTVTFGTNFRTTGTLATGVTSGRVFMLCFASDGTNYIELSRTAAIA